MDRASVSYAVAQRGSSNQAHTDCETQTGICIGLRRRLQQGYSAGRLSGDKGEGEVAEGPKGWSDTAPPAKGQNIALAD